MIEFARTLAARLLALFLRRSLDRDLDAELRSHLDMAVERNLAQGMSREQARRQALLDFGGVEQTRQIYRERRGLAFLDTLFQDLGFAFRMLRDRKSTRLNSSHSQISYAVFCLKKQTHNA